MEPILDLEKLAQAVAEFQSRLGAAQGLALDEATRKQIELVQAMVQQSHYRR